VDLRARITLRGVIDSFLLILFFILVPAEIASSQIAQPISASSAGRPTIQEASEAINQTADDAESERAAASLAKMGVPLERDAQGQVRWINASQGELSDEAMKCLPSLHTLEWLEIGGGNLSAAGLVHIGGCISLRRLYIHDITLRDDELTWLSNLPRLESLSLQRTRITGKALQNLKAPGSITILNLSETAVADEDLDLVRKFSGLEVLALQSTKVTGSGIAKLKGMPRLNVLNISSCRIHDSDVGTFATLPNLRIVHAEGCNLSDDAIQDLAAKIPLLAVFR
jgi:hypothetical protein